MNLGQNFLVFGVRVYQLVISPAKLFIFGGLSRCRFTPSCSEYALQAIRVHGAIRGSTLAVKRICRCHPWGGCGEDPIPPVSGPGRIECDRSGSAQISRAPEIPAVGHYSGASQSCH